MRDNTKCMPSSDNLKEGFFSLLDPWINAEIKFTGFDRMVHLFRLKRKCTCQVITLKSVGGFLI